MIYETHAKQVLYQHLESYMEHKRYGGNASDLHFVRLTNFGNSAVKITTEQAEDGLRFRVFLGLRHQLVEEWLANYGLPGTHYSQASYTLMVKSDRLAGGVAFEQWPAKTETEVGAIAESFIAFMDKTGFDFLDRYKELKAIDRLYNENTVLAGKLNSFNYQYAFRAMAMAKICHREDYDRLMAMHRQNLASRGFSGEILAKFDITFARLKHFSVN